MLLYIPAIRGYISYNQLHYWLQHLQQLLSQLTMVTNQWSMEEKGQDVQSFRVSQDFHQKKAPMLRNMTQHDVMAMNVRTLKK